MAESCIPVDRDQFCCPVCLGLFNNPLTVPCGHSFCMDCIGRYWDREAVTGIYQCPECQQDFKPRPVLGKNILLADMVEKKKQCGPVWCDVCPRGMQAAVKSCLRCVASYCEAHLKPHYASPALQMHQLTEATGCLQEMVCTLHKEPLKVYCRTDQRCVCLLCVMDEHRHHDTVSAVAERTEKQKSLCTAKKNSQKWIQERERKLQDVRQDVDSLTHTAQAAVEDSERIFADLTHSLERQCLKVKQLIQCQEKAAVAHAKGVQERLEREIAELRTRNAELEKLAETEDHIHFLQRWRSLSVPPPPHCGVPHVSFESVSRAVSELRDRLETVCQAEFDKISETVSRVNEVAALPSRKHKARAADLPSNTIWRAALQKFRSGETGSGCGHPAIKVPERTESLPEPRTRREFLRYARQLTLDPDTAHAELRLSAGDREVTRVKEKQKYPNNLERFDYRCQVLCREALSGSRCYWEAEVKGNKAEIAIAYKGIKRKGRYRASSFGGNDKSWSLDCINGVYSVCHNNNGTQLSVPYCSKIGVYLDHPAGTLSFYSVSDIMTPLYSVEAVFTEPVYPGFWIGEQCSVKLCNPVLSDLIPSSSSQSSAFTFSAQ